MRAERSPFPLGWWGIGLEHAGLGHVRPRVGTYGLYNYDQLPPLPIALRGDFAWLEAAPEQIEWPIGTEADRAELADKASRLTAAEPRLPPDFVTYLRTPSLHGRIRSHTACFLDFCPCSVPAPQGSGRLVRFLCDQQGCGYWYVYLAPDGDDAVVTSWTHYGAPGEWVDDGPEHPTYFVAESFEAFMCRYWLENEIGFCGTGDDLAPAARDYVEAYRRQEPA